MPDGSNMPPQPERVKPPGAGPPPLILDPQLSADFLRVQRDRERAKADEFELAVSVAVTMLRKEIAELTGRAEKAEADAKALRKRLAGIDLHAPPPGGPVPRAEIIPFDDMAAE